jgi:hypothetical protein
MLQNFLFLVFVGELLGQHFFVRLVSRVFLLPQKLSFLVVFALLRQLESYLLQFSLQDFYFLILAVNEKSASPEYHATKQPLLHLNHI